MLIRLLWLIGYEGIMTTETREKAEVPNLVKKYGPYKGFLTQINIDENDPEQKYYGDCVQALEFYLRREANSEAIKNDGIADALERRLIFIAKDWDMHRLHNMSSDDYEAAAWDAMQRYKKNWRNKEQGTDDRSHRLGKSSYTRNSTFC